MFIHYIIKDPINVYQRIWSFFTAMKCIPKDTRNGTGKRHNVLMFKKT